MTISLTASAAPFFVARLRYGAQLMPAIGAAMTGGHSSKSPILRERAPFEIGSLLYPDLTALAPRGAVVAVVANLVLAGLPRLGTGQDMPPNPYPAYSFTSQPLKCYVIISKGCLYLFQQWHPTVCRQARRQADSIKESKAACEHKS